MFISIQAIATTTGPLFFVTVEFDFHLGDVVEAAGAEERVGGGGGLGVAFGAVEVGKVGAPFQEVGAGAEALVGGVRVDDVEDCVGR